MVLHSGRIQTTMVFHLLGGSNVQHIIGTDARKTPTQEGHLQQTAIYGHTTAHVCLK